MTPQCASLFFFFFNDTATTEIYTLSLHDALPISPSMVVPVWVRVSVRRWVSPILMRIDRKSTRLNSSHLVISYAVFCLKKKKSVRADVHQALELDLARRRHDCLDVVRCDRRGRD